MDDAKRDAPNLILKNNYLNSYLERIRRNIEINVVVVLD